MTPSLNAEALTRSLTNPKGGAVAVVIYSNAYGPSVQVLTQVKNVIHDFPSIQLIPINAEEYGHLLGTPVLNVTEIPSVLLFYRGRPFSQTLTEMFQINTRLKRLALQSMEVDDFEPVGTTFRVMGANVSKWKPASQAVTKLDESVLAGLLSPLWTIMDSLYDI